MAAHMRTNRAITPVIDDPAPTPLIKKYLNKRQVMERVGRAYPTILAMDAGEPISARIHGAGKTRLV